MNMLTSRQVRKTKSMKRKVEKSAFCSLRDIREGAIVRIKSTFFVQSRLKNYASTYATVIRVPVPPSNAYLLRLFDGTQKSLLPFEFEHCGYDTCGIHEHRSHHQNRPPLRTRDPSTQVVYVNNKENDKVSSLLKKRKVTSESIDSNEDEVYILGGLGGGKFRRQNENIIPLKSIVLASDEEQGKEDIISEKHSTSMKSTRQQYQQQDSTIASADSGSLEVANILSEMKSGRLV